MPFIPILLALLLEVAAKHSERNFLRRPIAFESFTIGKLNMFSAFFIKFKVYELPLGSPF